MAFYNNMIANEMFLDTALMRESVVSHAKMLGYTPRSSVAPRATVNLQITRDVGSASSLTLPRFTKFASAPIGSTSYTFVNRDTVTVDFDPTCNRFCFDDLYIYQGQPLSYTFTYDSTNNPTGSFELPDAGIDTSTLEVVVQESSSSFRKEKFTLSTDSTNTVATSPVFFLEETRGGKYRIYFGDDVLGKKLTNGNIVIVTYIITQGSAANKANAFSLIDSVGGYSTSVVYPVTAASGGTGQESIESIRSTSTKAYISNNRGVTKDDIIGLINQRYPYFESVNVWGGEENDPPVYGKVFLAAKPTSGYEITESEKLDVINNVVKPVSVVTVIPEFVDVDYNYLNIYAEVYYDKTKTNRNADSLKALIRNAILAFRDSDLNDFNSKFKMSKMLRNIDDSDLSISYSDAICTIQKRFIPQVGAARNYTLNFGTPLTREDSRYPIYSTPAFRQYDADGVLRTCFMRETTGSSSGIESISVLAAPGTYETRPIIVISGDGVGASAYPIIVNGKITEIVVEKQGASYTTAKATVYATATDLEENNPDTTVDLLVSVEKRYGNLESYFFNENNESVVLNSSAGTIDYVLGKITLTEFDPVSISDPLKIFRINARPERNNFESSRSRIITIDEEDTDSVIIDVRKSE